ECVRLVCARQPTTMRRLHEHNSPLGRHWQAALDVAQRPTYRFAGIDNQTALLKPVCPDGRPDAPTDARCQLANWQCRQLQKPTKARGDGQSQLRADTQSDVIGWR